MIKKTSSSGGTNLKLVFFLLIIGIVGYYIFKRLAKPKWKRELEYYSKLSKLSPEEREEVIARDAAIRSEAHSRGFNQKFMKEPGLKSKKLMEYLNADSKGKIDRSIVMRR
jgi:hypothetical protein